MFAQLGSITRLLTYERSERRVEPHLFSQCSLGSLKDLVYQPGERLTGGT